MQGSEDIGGSFDPADIAAGTGNRELMCSIRLADGTEKVFGPYKTAAEMLSYVKPFCEEQVRLGNLSQQESDDMIQKYTLK